MYRILKECRYELVEKKSKFITRIMPAGSEETALAAIKEIAAFEKGAVHNCYAFRIFKNRSVLERKSDDGEPGGTAGAPMLAVLNGNDIVNVLAVTTRYFGGIKLGTGGLVNVYKKGVNEAVKLCEMKEFRIFTRFNLTFPVNETDHCLYLLKKENINVVSKEFGKESGMEVKFAVEAESADKLEELCGLIKGRYEIVVTE
jgi:uncharacterized YigZ family protein